jgi:hypothetical protein
MCYRKSRYRDESNEEVRGRRLWDLFHRETEAAEPPVPIAELEDEPPVTEREREEAPAGANR